jgi:hypothetical protein
MSRQVLILDTSVLCCWLKVPTKDEAGSVEDRWTFDRVDEEIERAKKSAITLVLPLATLIETGNHIAQAPHGRYDAAQRLAACLGNAALPNPPWAAFTDQSSLWEVENLTRLAKEWPRLAEGHLSIGDATIKDVAEYYARSGCTVEILTSDEGLKAYQPVRPLSVPRRRR